MKKIKMPAILAITMMLLLGNMFMWSPFQAHAEIPVEQTEVPGPPYLLLWYGNTDCWNAGGCYVMECKLPDVNGSCDNILAPYCVEDCPS